MTINNSIIAIRQALADSISHIDGLRAYAVYPGLVSPPAAVIRRMHTDYGTEFNGGDSSRFAVSLYLPSVDTVNSQTLLDTYLSRAGASSVVAALGADTSLGGIVRSAMVDSVDEEGLIELAGTTYLTARIDISVIHE